MIYENVESYLIRVGVLEKFEVEKIDFLKSVCEHFTLTDKHDSSPKSRLFHVMNHGNYSHFMTNKEMTLYIKFWADMKEDWAKRCPDPMGPLELVMFDQLLISYFKCIRLASKKMELDTEHGSAGWVADQILQKNIKLLFDMYPKRETVKAV